jgi:cell division septation protein DedD
MHRETLRTTLILVGALMLAAGVGLAISMGSETGSQPVADALKPADIAAATLSAAPPPRTLATTGLVALRGRPPVRPLPLAPRIRLRVRHQRPARVVRARPAAVAPARVVVTPAPAPVVTPRPVVVRPAPAPALKPRPAPARAPVVFDDSA